jgi:hypothetical protein
LKFNSYLSTVREQQGAMATHHSDLIPVLMLMFLLAWSPLARSRPFKLPKVKQYSGILRCGWAEMFEAAVTEYEEGT